MQKSNIVLIKNDLIDILLKENRSNVLLIIRKIANAGLDGRHVSDLVNDTKLSRPTVLRLCNQLREEGYITKRSKQEPYRLAEKLYGDPSHKTFLLQRSSEKSETIDMGIRPKQILE